MRRTFLGLAAVALFIGGVVMAPLTSEVAGSGCPAGMLPSGCVVAPSVLPAAAEI